MGKISSIWWVRRESCNVTYLPELINLLDAREKAAAILTSLHTATNGGDGGVDARVRIPF